MIGQGRVVAQAPATLDHQLTILNRHPVRNIHPATLIMTLELCSRVIVLTLSEETCLQTIVNNFMSYPLYSLS